MNSLVFPRSNARLCAQLGVGPLFPLGAPHKAFHNTSVVASKLTILIMIIHQSLLSSTGSGFCWDRFFFMRSILSVAVVRQEGL